MTNRASTIEEESERLKSKRVITFFMRIKEGLEDPLRTLLDF